MLRLIGKKGFIMGKHINKSIFFSSQSEDNKFNRGYNLMNQEPFVIYQDKNFWRSYKPAGVLVIRGKKNF